MVTTREASKPPPPPEPTRRSARERKATTMAPSPVVKKPPRGKQKKKVKASRPKSVRECTKRSKKNTAPKVLTNPDTGETVYLSNATVQDLKLAEKRNRPPWLSSRRYLVTVQSPANRQHVYRLACAALEDLEQRVLPLYGGRPWQVQVTIKDERSPYFCWHSKRGRLELAAWPHIVEKMPDPPRFPGYYAGGGGSSRRSRRTTTTVATTTVTMTTSETTTTTDVTEAGDMNVEEEDEDEDVVEELSDFDLMLQDLQEREVSGLSQLAWTERWRVPVPTIHYKWVSPLRQSFTSRKSAWEHAVQLCKQEVLLDKVLTGYGANGKALKVANATLKNCMTAGKMRFERDGLWVVGQEEAWGIERLQQESVCSRETPAVAASSVDVPAITTDAKEKKVRRWTGLTYFLHCKRIPHRAKRLKEMRSKNAATAAVPEPVSELAVENDTGPADTNEDVTAVCTSSNDENATIGSVSLQTVQAKDMTVGKPVAPKPVSELAVESHTGPADTNEDLATVCTSCNDENATIGSVSLQTVQAKDMTVGKPVAPESVSELAVESHTGPADPKEDVATVCTSCNDENATIGSVSLQTVQAKDTEEDVTALRKFSNDEGAIIPAVLLQTAQPKNLRVGKSVLSESSKNPKKVSLTLREAEDELRHIWKSMSNEQKVAWISDAKAKQDAIDRSKSKLVDPVQHNVVGMSVAPSSDASLVLPSGCDTKSSDVNMTTDGGTIVSIVSASPSPSSVSDDQSDGDTSRTLSTLTKGTKKEAASEPLIIKALLVEKNRIPSALSKKLKDFARSKKWCLNDDQIKLCYDAGIFHYDSIMRTVTARDLTRELQDGFDLLRERGHGRFDMELPAFDAPEFKFLLHSAPWMPIVKEILGKEAVLIHKGMFLSMPGSSKQAYHQDGPHLSTQYQKPCHAINVFIPLVDLTFENGPTEFCLGSHILGHEEFDDNFLELPTVQAGTPVIFDYRLGHRGLANTSSACRPIVYCTYAAATDGKEFRDSVNFSRKRYHKIGELVEKGLTREQRAEKRKRGSMACESSHTATVASAVEPSTAKADPVPLTCSDTGELVEKGQTKEQRAEKRKRGTLASESSHTATVATRVDVSAAEAYPVPLTCNDTFSEAPCQLTQGNGSRSSSLKADNIQQAKSANPNALAKEKMAVSLRIVAPSELGNNHAKTSDTLTQVCDRSTVTESKTSEGEGNATSGILTGDASSTCVESTQNPISMRTAA